MLQKAKIKSNFFNNSTVFKKMIKIKKILENKSLSDRIKSEDRISASSSVGPERQRLSKFQFHSIQLRSKRR